MRRRRRRAIQKIRSAIADLAAKLSENVAPLAGPEHTKKLERKLFSIERTKNVRELTTLLMLGKEAAINSAQME